MSLGLSIITNTDSCIFLVPETAEVLNEWQQNITNAINASKDPELQSISKAQSVPTPTAQKKEEPKAPSTDSFSSDFSTFG